MAGILAQMARAKKSKAVSDRTAPKKAVKKKSNTKDKKRAKPKKDPRKARTGKRARF